VWEVRVALGADPVSGRSRVRSLTVHGDRKVAQLARLRWAEEADRIRVRGHARAGLTVADLLADWLATDHGWRPSTLAGNRSAAGHVARDRLGRRPVTDVSPNVVRATCAAWSAAGWTDPTIYARIRVLRSAISWAYAERILDMHPLDGMRSPPATSVRMHATVEQIRDLLSHSKRELDQAINDRGDSGTGWARVHHAEQVRLVTELAADSGARRGELAALQTSDLAGDVLTISRGTSSEIVGPTKTGRARRLTLSPTTAQLWREQVDIWQERCGPGSFGPWLFSALPDHSVRLTTGCLGHWFWQMCHDAGHPDVTLHRLRHSVATFLVERGDILAAQYRLGHRDAGTTLRTYSHVLPMTDGQAAATLERLLHP
jgi:integrase